MTGLWLLLGLFWGAVLVVRRRRLRKRADVLIGAGESRDYLAGGGGF